MKLILASQSPQRKLLLQSLGIKFQVVPADLDESKIRAENHRERVKQLALAKAQIVMQKQPNAIVIGCDTYPVLNDQALEKPRTKKEAAAMLGALSGIKTVGYTGFAYLDENTQQRVMAAAEFSFKFRRLSNWEIEDYVARNPVTTWSAGFAPCYPAGASLIESCSGSFTGFIYGLPLELLVPCLSRSGLLD